MPLQSGNRLGPYEIGSRLGAGGMGEVYRATDTRLGRAVAVKILPSQFSKRDDLRQRFETEARAVSSLNHPHICTLHDVGQENIDGDLTHYLVMELVEGESLAQRLAKGPLPLDHALRIGGQIADALDRAHRRGIIHRDLKPANVMLTKSGAKLLDFGLAKLSGGVAMSGDATTMNAVTAEGMIVGTLQYMSPEQLEGKEIDHRTDIFSLGALLYEMVTGKRAFDGASQASIIAAILHHRPAPPSETQPIAPRALDRVIATCMEKDPDDRWQSAHDVMLQLQTIGDAREQAPTVMAPMPVSPRRKWLALAAATLIGAAIAVAAVLLWRRPAQSSEVTRKLVASIELKPPMVLLAGGFGPPLAMSADGSRIAWIGLENGRTALYVRFLDSPEVHRLEGTEGAALPFFSPDGENIAFFDALGRLKTVTLRGVMTDIAATGPGSGACWLADGTIVYSQAPGEPLLRVPARGGKIEQITSVDQKGGEAGHSWPTALPDGKTILYSVEQEGKSWDAGRICAVSLDTKKTRVVLEGGVRGRYVSSGHLIFTRGGKLLAVRFDPKTLETSGEPFVIVEDVVSQVGNGAGFYDVSADGLLVYLEGDATFFSTRPTWVRDDGTAEALAVPPRTYVHVRIAHDGQRIAMQISGANDDIWIYDIARATFTRLTTMSENLFPAWSPDDRAFIYSTVYDGPPRLVVSRVDGGGERQPFVPNDQPGSPQFVQSWSRDGRIAYLSMATATGTDIYIVPDDGRKPSAPFLKTRFNEGRAAFSPDAKSIAYSSDESGQIEVYVRPSDGGEKTQISTAGGSDPVWSHDGRRLFFSNGDVMYGVDVTPGAPPRFGPPRKLFERPMLVGQVTPAYDVDPTGRGFLIIENPRVPEDGRLLRLVANPLAGRQ